MKYTFIISCLMFFSEAQSVIVPEPVIFDQHFSSGVAGTNARLGAHMAMDNNKAVVTMPHKGDVLVYQHNGSSWHLESTFNTSNGLQYPLAYLIHSVAIKDDLIVVGNVYDDTNGSNTGAAYVFELMNNDWVKTATLKAPQPATASGFGYAVAINTDRIVVGSPHDPGNTDASGAVYVYGKTNNTWSLTQTITPNDANGGDEFGAAVNVFNDHLIIGAPKHNYNAATTGAAYVFEFDGSDYLLNQKLLGDPAAAESLFGGQVFMKDDLIAVAAPEGFNDFFLRSGAVYIFRNDGAQWLFEDKVSAGAKEELFGKQLSLVDDQLVVIGQSGTFTFNENMNQWSLDQWIMGKPEALAVQGDLMLTGDPEQDNVFQNDGLVYAHQFNGTAWAESEELTGADSNESELFGYAVGALNDDLLVGIPNDRVNFTPKSSVRVMQKQANDWVQVDSLVPSDSHPNLVFGTHIHVHNNQAFITASENGHPNAIYVFEKQNNQWTEVQKITSPNAFNDDGFGHQIAQTGDFLFINSSKNPQTSMNLVEVFEFNGGTWQPSQTLSSQVTDDGFGYQLKASGDQLLATVDNSQGQHAGLILVYEEVSPSQWQWTQSIQPPNGIPNNAHFDKISVDQDTLVVSTTTSYLPCTGCGSVTELFLHSYQNNNGVWSYQQSSDMLNLGGGIFHDLKINNDLLFMSVGYPNFFVEEHFVRAYFYDITNLGFDLQKRFTTHVEIEPSSFVWTLSTLIHNETAFIGFPGDPRVSPAAGSVLRYHLNAPDLIMANGFE